MKTFCAVALLANAVVSTTNAERLRVTIYERVPLGNAVRTETFDYLRWAFDHTGIDLQLVTGDPAAEEAHTVMYVAASHSTCLDRREIALDIGNAPPGLRSSAIGIALPFADKGLNARIFLDRVERTAQLWGKPLTLVLADAITHEIGHILMPTAKHEATGVMAASWTGHEYDLLMARTRRSLFTREQSRQMRATLTREHCLSSKAPAEQAKGERDVNAEPTAFAAIQQ